MSDRTRVLVVDDSAFARKVISDVLSASKDIEVVGIARDGLDALERIIELRPDVITLDLMMPNLDGVGVLDHLLGQEHSPKVVLVTTHGADSELAIRALERGAIDLVHKPTSLATVRLYDIEEDLVAKVRNAAAAHVRRVARSSERRGVPKMPLARTSGAPEVVVIGASTGGPNALVQLLPSLPLETPVPVIVVLHIPVGYTHSLAARWNELCPLDVVEATDGTMLRAGQIVLAQAGVHLAVRKTGEGHATFFEHNVTDGFHRPSVDRVFESASIAYAGRVLGVVLTGMGEDGLRGARAIRAAGGDVITEAESTCVVYGMPRAVDEAGLSSQRVPIGSMADAVARRL